MQNIRTPKTLNNIWLEAKETTTKEDTIYHPKEKTKLIDKINVELKNKKVKGWN